MTQAHLSLALFSFVLLTPVRQALAEEGTTAASVSTSETSEGPSEERVTTAHVQATLVPQRHEAMTSPYQGGASFIGNSEQNASFSGTVFLGYRPFKNTDVFFNPEFIDGGGLSDAYGLGAYPNGEINRVGNAGVQANLARLYVSQTIPLGGELENVTDDQNQIAGRRDSHYLRFTAGKYSLADFLDSNAYGHDQRNQFLNWCFMDNCAWDYSMNPIGYTYAFLTELNMKSWAVRLLVATEPTAVNGATMDWDLNQSHSANLELERSFAIGSHPGKIRFLVYENGSLARKYDDAVLSLTSVDPDTGVAPVINPGQYNIKYGGGINVEQEITENIGVFARVGANNGTTESWTFTEADQTLAGGATYSGRAWSRVPYTLGLGIGVNGISPAHRAFLDNGGQGLMLGDGVLNYAPEQFAELYCSFDVPGIKRLAITPDFQYIQNPGFNQDRGPVAISAIRLHYEWGI